MSRELTPQETAERSLIKTYRKSIWNPLSPLEAVRADWSRGQNRRASPAASDP